MAVYGHMVQLMLVLVHYGLKLCAWLAYVTQNIQINAVMPVRQFFARTVGLPV